MIVYFFFPSAWFCWHYCCCMVLCITYQFPGSTYHGF